jgi:hypothetical protein
MSFNEDQLNQEDSMFLSQNQILDINEDPTNAFHIGRKSQSHT